MKIPVEEILSCESFDVEETFLPEDIKADVRISSPVEVKMKISHGSNDEFIVEGKIKTTFVLNCVSCLEDFHEPFEVKFNEVYINENKFIKKEGELGLNDLEVFTYKGDSIDTAEIARNIINGSIPLYPKCPKCR